LEQNDIKFINLIRSVYFIPPRESQHTYTCYDQRQLRHVSLNVIIIVVNI